jgi:hypothetical protein
MLGIFSEQISEYHLFFCQQVLHHHYRKKRFISYERSAPIVQLFFMIYYFRFQTMFRLFKRKPKDQAPISKYKVTASKDQVSVTPVNYISPFRSMNDFISNDPNAWNIPDFSDTARLKNRIINNLIYYQTNYGVLGIQLMLLVG